VTLHRDQPFGPSLSRRAAISGRRSAEIAESIASTFEHVASTYRRMAATRSANETMRLLGHVSRLEERAAHERVEAVRLRREFER